MTSRPTLSKGRSLLRLAVAGAVAVAGPFAVAGTANAVPDSVWDKLAQCESGGRWHINTGNGYSGGLQFSASTWRAYGGSGAAHQASREQQIAVAERVLAAQGWGAWPACSRKLGLRGYSAEPRKVQAAEPRRVQAAEPRRMQAAEPRRVQAAEPRRVQAAESTPAAPPAAAPVTKNGADYTVVAGDTLSKIAARENIPGGWPTLWERNRDVLSDPDLILVGQQLDLH